MRLTLNVIIFSIALAIVIVLSCVPAVPVSAQEQWLFTPVPTPEVVSDTITLGQQQAQTYEQVRQIHLLLLFILPGMLILALLQFLRVRR